MSFLLALVLPLVQVQQLPHQPYPPPPFGALYCAQVSPTYCDPYWIDGPANLVAGQKYPLVVMFHGTYEGASPPWHAGALEFMDAAKSWTGPKPYIVVLHDGGIGQTPAGTWTNSTYGSEAFHRATEAVLADVVAKWPVDRKRIYGYGHSMGGGEVASFAARHQDPTRPTFLAAIVSQSGTVSVPRILTIDPGFHALFQTLYPAPPYGTSAADQFHYQRATALDLPFPASATAPLDYDLKWGFHLAHNLRWVSRANFHATTADDLEQMVEPTQTWEAFLADPRVNAPDQVGLLPEALNVHSWNAVLPATILTYFDARDRTSTLAQFSTQLSAVPGYGTELLLFAGDNARHHCFSIERADTTRFGRLHVRFYPPAYNLNAVVLAIDHDNAADNVAKTYVHVDAHLTQMQWGVPSAPPVLIYAPQADLGTIDALNAPLPQQVEYGIWTGSTWVWQVSTDWSHSGTTLSLPEDPASGLQRYWKITY